MWIPAWGNKFQIIIYIENLELGPNGGGNTSPNGGSECWSKRKINMQALIQWGGHMLLPANGHESGYFTDYFKEFTLKNQ